MVNGVGLAAVFFRFRKRYTAPVMMMQATAAALYRSRGDPPPQ